MKIRFKDILFLNAILLIYSLAGFFSKNAASTEFLSLGFIVNYGIVLAILFIYAILWQQVLKRLPLMIAFANKAVVIIWGIIWGTLFFSESLTIGMIIGAIVIIAGVCLVVSDDV